MASRQESLCWTRSEIVSKSSLGIPLAKASNSSRIRALGVQNTRLESLRNQPEIVPKASNRSRIRGKCVRNTSHKNYRTLPLESIKNKQLYSPSTSQETVRLPVIAPKSSRNLALENGSERLKQVRSSGIAPTSSRNLALENGSESLEQQQDSCPRHAKHKPEKLSKRRRRNPIKGKKKDSLQALRHRKKHFYYSQVRSSGIAPKSSRNLALENSSESLEQQQDSCPRHAKHKPIKLSKRRLRNPLKGKKKDSLQAFRHRKKHFYYSQARSSGSAPKASRNLALENGSESLEQQQDSCPRHAKHKPI